MSAQRKPIAYGVEKGPTKEVSSPLVMTIGHSTRSLEEFIGLLQAHGVARVVDVRTISRSWHNPQFNQDSLPVSLKKVGLSYVHLPGLGGLRQAKPDSINLGWRNATFRGHADYMQTPGFAQSLDGLVQLANQRQIVLMCAEAVPWRCHRSLIADALLVREIRAEDIMSLTRRTVHALTPFAKVCGATITYPTEKSGLRKRKAALNRDGCGQTEVEGRRVYIRHSLIRSPASVRRKELREMKRATDGFLGPVPPP